MWIDNITALRQANSTDPPKGPYAPVIAYIQEQLRELEDRGIAIRLAWSPGHSNNPVNDAADAAASQGLALSRQGVLDASIPLPRRTITQTLRHQCNLKWQEHIHTATTSPARTYHRFHPLVYEQSPIFTLSRSVSSRAKKVIALLFFSPFNPPPRTTPCSPCNQQPDTPFHVLFDCPIHATTRSSLMSHLASSPQFTIPQMPDDPHNALRLLALAATSPSFHDSPLCQLLDDLCSDTDIYDRLFPPPLPYSISRR